MNTLQQVLASSAADVINSVRVNNGLPTRVHPDEIGDLMHAWHRDGNKVNMIKSLREMTAGRTIASVLTYDPHMHPMLRAQLAIAVSLHSKTTAMGLKEAKDLCEWLIENWSKLL